jgi:hypothetical protein
MRRVTQQEGESWRALAQQHGFGSAEGRFVLGRFIVEDRDENGLLLCVVTPIPAGLDAEKAQIETLPVMFNRTPADEIVVPGRWWQMMFENVSADAAAPAEMRQMADTIAATTICRDVLLPADSDTVEIGIVDSQGKLVRYEALPPGTRMRARLELEPGALVQGEGHRRDGGSESANERQLREYPGLEVRRRQTRSLGFVFVGS